MAEYYVGQDNIQIRLETGQDLTGATCLIKYKKPNGETGSWSATIDTSDDDNSIMYYNVEAGDIDVNGIWYFWAYVTWSTGSIGIGQGASQRFKIEGSA